MKALPTIQLSKGFKDLTGDSVKIQDTLTSLIQGLRKGLTLTENLNTQLLTVPFLTPQDMDLSIATTFTEKPVWVELVSFSKVLPTYEAKSLGASFRWTWGDRTITTDVFNGMPSDECVYQIQLLVFSK